MATSVGPSESRLLGWQAPDYIFSEAPSALMSRVPSTQPKGRAVMGRKPEGSQPENPAALQPRVTVLQPGLQAAHRQRQVSQQSQTKYARVELEATGPFPLLLSPGRTAGSAVSDYKRQRFQERSYKRSLKREKQLSLLLLLYPNLSLSLSLCLWH